MRPRRALRGPWRVRVAGVALLRLEGGVGGSWAMSGKGILRGPGGLGLGLAGRRAEAGHGDGMM